MMTELVISEKVIASGDNISINFDHAISLAERLDFLDVQLLRKFYMNGKEQPLDLQPYCFPMLFKEMKVGHKMKIGSEALRKRLDNLVKLSLLEKIKHANPANYSPLINKQQFVRAVVAKFFVINGLTQFL